MSLLHTALLRFLRNRERTIRPSHQIRISPPHYSPRARRLEQRLEAAAAAAVSQLTNNIVASNASQTPEQLEGTNYYGKKMDLWSFFAG